MTADPRFGGPRITRYTGPRPEKASLPSVGPGVRGVPDNPVPLPADHLACLACGVAVPLAEHPAIIHTEAVSRAGPVQPVNAPPMVFAFARCRSCAVVHSLAEQLVATHPSLSQRMADSAVHRAEGALIGLVVLDLPLPSPSDVEEAAVLLSIRYLSVPGISSRWMARFAPVLVEGAHPRTCAPST